MGYPYYAKGLDGQSSQPADKIRSLRFGETDDPEAYRPAPGLREAVNAALILGRPLLVTGEPGTGKTQLAYSIAHELSRGAERAVPVRKFETKSTSVARDLFYTFDAISAFQSTPDNEGKRRPVTDFITFQALGRAILEACEYDHPKVKVIWPDARDEKQRKEDQHQGPCRSVVLIDEIDKAPRDFPNDLLNEIERMYFKIFEFENRPSPNENGDEIASNMRPIVVITSNSERALPDAFLRRCLYFHVAFPKEDEMRAIVGARLPEIASNVSLVDDAMKLFYDLRRTSGSGVHLRKEPSTAELLDWLRLIEQIPGAIDSDRKNVFERTVTALAKSDDDRKAAIAHINGAWKPVGH